MIKNRIQKSQISNYLTEGGCLNLCRFLAAAFLFVCTAAVLPAPASAQTAMVTNNFVAYPPLGDATLINNQCSVVATTADYEEIASATYDRSFYLGSDITPANSLIVDPWVKSALIEYDQPFPIDSTTIQYPNHCLTLCGQVTCSNPVRRVAPPEGVTTGTMFERSGSFPIQTILFEVFKYAPNSNPYNPDSTPPIKTIALYPTDSKANTCRGVGAWQEGLDGNHPTSGSCCDTCFVRPDDACRSTCNTWTNSTDCNNRNGCGWSIATNTCISTVFCGSYSTQETCPSGDSCSWHLGIEELTRKTGGVRKECRETCDAFNSALSGFDSGEIRKKDYEECVNGTTKLNFCAPWDGMYEIDGEHGKSNGQFGYRTSITSKWPGDGVSTPDIDISHTIVYPGNQQIPIQVDVTNVHSVRATPTMVGAKQAVPAQPYRLRYRLSKDALTAIKISDPDSTTIHRNLINDEPRIGEGASATEVITEEEAWDGRDNKGRLLPYGNYLVAIQAKSKDEWTGTASDDVSRAVTRQLSLDPLKITDITATGLTKTSTSHAMLSYMITESATVHVEVYTPGTVFTNLMISPTFSSTAVVPVISATSGHKVAEFIENKASRVTVNTKWDGRCWYDNGGVEDCTSAGYNIGSALPDGEYVYLIWAEIPYTDGTIEINGIEWNGVKTRLIHNGFLPISRGLPEILIQPVGYSTIGSSPTAFGLDPFILRFSLSRDAIVTARIKTTSDLPNGAPTAMKPPYVVKTLLDNQVKIANQMNVESWDGKDDNGRYISPGTYLFEVVARDAMFPEKAVTSTVMFPVDLLRVVDVTTTPIIGEATSQAEINYMLSKSMDVKVDIYEPGVVIPSPGNSNAACPVVCPSGSPAANCIHIPGSSAVPEPIKSFVGTRPGEGVVITEMWDGYSYDTSNQQILVEDGMYPYIICARSNIPGADYYQTNQLYPTTSTADGLVYPVDGKDSSSAAALNNTGTTQREYIYASDKPVGHITIARGPVYFSTILIKPSVPQLFFSSETIQIPTYEVQFAVTRTASVRVDIISTEAGMCMNGAPAGTVCRTLTQLRPGIMTSVYDPIVINKLYWDGKDERGEYVRKSGYEFRFTADPYPQTNQVSTIRSEIVTVNNFQVFDRFIWDVSPQNKGMGKFAYQISVPMKVAIQIFKPGTRIANPADGTLVDPADPSGPAVTEQTVDRVLVKAIIGVRPHLVSLEDVWDGTDLAGQRVPDGVYPFRFVTVLDSYNMSSINGGALVPSGGTIADVVADWDKYINLSVINVANGDSFFADLDWKSNQVTMFFPNPLRQDFGHFEITKVPAPGIVTIKIFNIAGDLVKDGGYSCHTARGVEKTLEDWNRDGGLSPDMGGSTAGNASIIGGRNFALRCRWNKDNNHGKKVARGLYYAIMELNPTRGNAPKSQKVIKILIP